MINILKKELIKQKIFNLSLKKCNFSVFTKLKNYLKSGSQHSATMFGSYHNPDDIKPEFDENLSSKKTRVKGEKLKLSKEDINLVENLPKNLISKII